MKFFFLALIISSSALATRSVTIKGKLESYTDTHFKLKEEKKTWRLPLTVMNQEDRAVIEKKVGKEIEVSAPVHIVKKSK